MHKRIHSRVSKHTTTADCSAVDCPPRLLKLKPSDSTCHKSTAPTAARQATVVQCPPSSIAGPVIWPFSTVLPMIRAPMFDVNSALLRLPSLSKLVQMRDADKR